MNEKIILFSCIFLLSVFISSVSQVVLKKSATKQHDSKLKEYMNLPVIVAYGLFFSASLLTVLAYKVVPLSLGPVLETTGYIWVSILGAIFLKEKMTKKKLLGMILIVIGILIFNGDFVFK